MGKRYGDKFSLGLKPEEHVSIVNPIAAGSVRVLLKAAPNTRYPQGYRFTSDNRRYQLAQKFVITSDDGRVWVEAVPIGRKT